MRLLRDIRARNHSDAHFIVSFHFFTLSSFHALVTSLNAPTTIYKTATKDKIIEIFFTQFAIITLSPSSTQRVSSVVTILVLELEKQFSREEEISVQKVQVAKVEEKIKKERKNTRNKIIFFIIYKIKDLMMLSI